MLSNWLHIGWLGYLWQGGTSGLKDIIHVSAINTPVFMWTVGQESLSNSWRGGEPTFTSRGIEFGSMLRFLTGFPQCISVVIVILSHTRNQNEIVVQHVGMPNSSKYIWTKYPESNPDEFQQNLINIIKELCFFSLQKYHWFKDISCSQQRNILQGSIMSKENKMWKEGGFGDLYL